MVAACVSAPQGVPSVDGAEGRGQPLAASESVVLYLSASLLPPESRQDARSPSFRPPPEVHPLQDTNAAYRALAQGFGSVRSDVRVVVADDALRQACFDGGDRLAMGDAALLVRPDVQSPRCRALVDERRVRYFVSVVGWGSTASTNVTENLGTGVRKSARRVHWFEFVAHAYDAGGGPAVCEERALETAHSSQGAGLAIVPAPPVWFPLPLLWRSTVDDSAFFERAAWIAGARAGMCFVEPAKARPPPDGAPGSSPTHQQWCLVDPASNPVACEIDTYDECLARRPDSQHRCTLRQW